MIAGIEWGDSIIVTSQRSQIPHIKLTKFLNLAFPMKAEFTSQIIEYLLYFVAIISVPSFQHDAKLLRKAKLTQNESTEHIDLPISFLRRATLITFPYSPLNPSSQVNYFTAGNQPLSYTGAQHRTTEVLL